MSLRTHLLALLVALGPAAAAQAPAGCARATAEAVLDAAGVRAELANDGALFRGFNAETYAVPKRTSEGAIFIMNLWVAGLADGELRMAGSQYGPQEFWPGPLDASGATTPATCAAYDRIWTVSTADLAAYEATGSAPDDLAAWPVGIGAPFFVDADGDGTQGAAEPTVSLDPGDPGYGPRTIDLAAGERPVVFGQQTAWWVMNDVGDAHESFDTAPLGVEVRATAWVHATAAAPALGHATFYRYEVVNRSGAPRDSVHVGLFADVDLREPYWNDAVHSDTLRDLAVYYDLTPIPDTPLYPAEAQGRSPALGIDLLSGAAGAMAFRRGAGVLDTPTTPEGAAALFRGRWRDGTPMREGGLGHPDFGGTGAAVPWAFPGDPVARAFWSEENDGGADVSHDGDKRGVIYAPPVRLAPGERVTVDAAVLFAEGSRLGAVAALRDASDQAQALYRAGALMAPAAAAAPLAAPVLGGPADGDTLTSGPLRLSWDPVPGATEYVVRVSTAPSPLRGHVHVRTTGTSLEVPPYALPLNRSEPLYWDVRATSPITESEASAPKAFFYDVPAFTTAQIVANADGPLDEPVRILPTFGGGQATTFISWGLGAVGTTDTRAFHATVAPDDPRLTFPRDYEMRFTGTSQAVIEASGRVVEVPFELWDIGVGTPDDPADDVRLIPILHDVVGDGAFSIGPMSAESRASMTDGVSWALPTDRAPGERGYRAWALDPAGAARGPVVLREVTLYRGGRVTGSTPAEAYPEEGTIIRLVSSTRARDVAAPEAPGATLAVEVRPNPSATRAVVAYRLEAAGPVRLRVVDVLGREVAVLAEGERAEGEHRAALDAARLAPGVYVVELRAGDARAVRTMTVAR